MFSRQFYEGVVWASASYRNAKPGRRIQSLTLKEVRTYDGGLPGDPDSRPWTRRNIMKQAIHPAYNQITVTCACGETFQTRSTRKDDLHVEICSACHPFFTGKQKLIDTAGRVDRFNKRYGKKAETAPVEGAPAAQ